MSRIENRGHGGVRVRRPLPSEARLEVRVLAALAVGTGSPQRHQLGQVLDRLQRVTASTDRLVFIACPTQQHAHADGLHLRDAQGVPRFEQPPCGSTGGLVRRFVCRRNDGGSQSGRRAHVQAGEAKRFEVSLVPLAGKNGPICVGLFIRRDTSQVRQAGRPRVILGNHGGVARTAEAAITPRPLGTHPLGRQPVERTRGEERERVRRRMRPVPVGQPLQAASHAQDRRIRLGVRRQVANAELGRVADHLLDCAGARQEGHQASERVHARGFETECCPDRADRLARA